MEITEVAKQIQKHITLLKAGRKQLQVRAEEKAEAMCTYEQMMAVTIVKLAVDGEVSDSDGNVIKDLGATNREALAKGVCNPTRYTMDLANSRYKNAIKGLDVLQSELNALQSIFRHLDES